MGSKWNGRTRHLKTPIPCASSRIGTLGENLGESSSAGHEAAGLELRMRLEPPDTQRLAVKEWEAKSGRRPGRRPRWQENSADRPPPRDNGAIGVAPGETPTRAFRCRTFRSPRCPNA